MLIHHFFSIFSFWRHYQHHVLCRRAETEFFECEKAGLEPFQNKRPYFVILVQVIDNLL